MPQAKCWQRDWLVTGNIRIEVDIDSDSATVTREVDGGLQTIKVNASDQRDLRLNEPREASAKHHESQEKPLDEKTAADYGVDVASRLDITTAEPEARAAVSKLVLSMNWSKNLKKQERYNGCSTDCNVLTVN